MHGIQTHWMKQKIEKNTVNYEFAMEYLKSCLEQDEFAEKADGKMDRLNPRSRITVTIKPKKDIVLMRNFSYITLNEVAGSSTPKRQQHIDALEHIGITLIITLTEEEALEEMVCKQTQDWECLRPSSELQSTIVGANAKNRQVGPQGNIKRRASLGSLRGRKR